jgi:hypothetical protein
MSMSMSMSGLLRRPGAAGACVRTLLLRPLLVLQERDGRDAAVAARALSWLLLAARRLLLPIMLWAMRTLRLLRPALLRLLTIAMAMVVRLRARPARRRLALLRNMTWLCGACRCGARSVALRPPIGRRDRHPDQLFDVAQERPFLGVAE